MSGRRFAVNAVRLKVFNEIWSGFSKITTSMANNGDVISS